VVICLERGADLHMAQLMPLTLTLSSFSKIQIGFAFLVPAHLGSPGHRAVKRVCVCVAQSHSATFFFFGFMRKATTDTRAPILMQNTSNDVVPHKDVPFGGRETNINIDPLFPPQNCHFWAPF